MDLNELKGLSNEEAIKRAAEFAGVRPEILDGIWRTETGRGTHPTMIGPETKWGTAKGHFQQLDSIVNTWRQRTGKELDPFDFHDGLYMAALHMRENVRRYGNEEQAVLAYHGGTDPKNWGPKTQDYLRKVVGAAEVKTPTVSDKTAVPRHVLPEGFAAQLADLTPRGEGSLRTHDGYPARRNPDGSVSTEVSITVTDPRLNDGKPTNIPSLWRGVELSEDDAVTAAMRSGRTFAAYSSVDEAVASARQRSAAGGASAKSSAPMPTIQRDPLQGDYMPAAEEGDFRARVSQQADALDTAAPAHTWSEKQDAAYTNEMEPWFNIARQWQDGGPEKDLAWMRYAAANDTEVFKDVPNEDDREFLREAVSAADLEYRKARLAERKANEDVTFRDGFWSGMGHTVVAGLRNPVTASVDLLAGALTGGAGTLLLRGGRTAEVAARAAGMAGRVGTLVRGGAEGAVGSLAVDGLLVMAGEYRSAADIAAGSIASAGLGTLFSVPAYRQASKRQLEEFESKVLSDAVGGKIETLRQAVDELGPEADPAVIGRRASEIEAQRLKEDVTAALNAAPEADRLPAAEVVPEAEDAASRSIAGAPQELRSRINDDDIYAPFEDPAFLQRRKDAWAMRSDWREGAYSRAPELDTLGAGVHTSQTATPAVRAAADAITPILRKYLPPEAKVVIGTEVKRADVDGVVTSVGDLHVIGLRNDPNRPVGMLHTALHEGGHVVFHQWAQHIPTPILARVNDDWLAYVKRLRQMDPDAVNDRFAATSPNRTERLGEALPRTKYVANRDEWIAEQFVKHVQDEAGKGTYGDVPRGIIDRIVTAVRNAVQFLLDATRTSKVKPEESVAEMFTWVLNNANKSLKEAEEFLDPSLRLPDLDAAAMPVGGFKGPAMLSPEKPRITGADYDFARKYGLDLMPQNTPLERAEFKAVLDIYRKAEAWVAANPRLDERARTLLNKSAMFQVTGTALASSENPVARMVAGTLLESTTGAQGRRNTAAIAADMHNRRFLGNSVHAYTSVYEQWRKLHDGSVFDDVFKGTMRERFDRAVALEIEGRRAGRTGSDKLVARAADHLEAAYERMRAAQVQTGTVGYAMLPDTATGYMPHVLNKAKVNAMTPDELRTFVDIMTEQFQTIEGFDAKFSAELARKYVDHARVNANGGHEIPANIHQPGAADMVRKALEDMGVGREALVEMMQRFSRGGPSYTKQRLHLDLTREYPNGVKLLDLYDTNQLELLRRYSRRVSGEVALAQFGVMGSQGLRLLRRAMEFGPDADKPELRQAFDQVAAEFLGQPFGNATGKWMDRALQANGLARLGGMGFTQAGEMVNAIAHIGVLQSLDTIPALPRLRREVHAIARGEKVENGILNSIEQFGGAGEFGVDGYRMVLPYDDPSGAYHSYGKDTVTAVDKLLRAGNYTQGILSGWRMIHAVQQRAVAEQITLKAIRYIRDGLESKALEDMGFTKAVQAKLKRDLPNMVEYDERGRVKVFDLTKATDADVAATFAQSVLRGTNQIIQGQFIGETGKWAHDGWLKMFTQFRTFPLVAMEKQWARQRHNHGLVSTIGLLAGSIAAVSPIIMLRVALASVGRPDQEEYLEEKLQPANIARMALNYVAMAGLAGDLVDAVSAVAPDGLLGDETGARSGGARGAVGNLFAPSLGYVDDAYKAMQDADNPHKWAQLLPMSRLPFVVPLLNTLRNED